MARNLVEETLKVISKEPLLTRECMTPGGNGEGKMKEDEIPADLGTKKGRQPDDTGQPGEKKPKKITDETPK